MATGRIMSGSPLYYGPGTAFLSSPGATAAENVEILWQEGSYYYVQLSSPNRRLYTPKSRVTSVSGTVTAFSPTFLTRYVTSEDEGAKLGPGTGYQAAAKPEFPFSVRFINGKKENGYALIEYTPASTSYKIRAWYNANYLATVAKTPGKYTTGNIINYENDKWGVSSGWNGSSGHLGIDVRRCTSSGGYFSNANARGTGVYAVAEGKVVVASSNTGGSYYDIATGASYHGNGKCVIIEHTTSSGKKYYSTYCHLNSIAVSENSIVNKYQRIGEMGSTGRVQFSGTADAVVHLHLHITKHNKGTGAWGYYRINGEQMQFVGNDCVEYDGTIYYNPTAYFQRGDALINENY